MILDIDISLVEHRLRDTCALIHHIPAPSAAGVYAAFLCDVSALKPFTPRRDGVIYVGKSSNLARREFDDHFNSAKTGFSTLRRSLGAILKRRWNLTAIPRSSGSSETNVRNFRFVAKGETELTEWMCTNIKVGICEVQDHDILEETLISRMEPLLNLKGWRNPDRDEIKSLRKICADEARSIR